MNLLKFSQNFLLIAKKIEKKKKKKKKDINNLNGYLENTRGSSRRNYYSSFDRSSYNYGYMTESEMSGPNTDNVWT